VGDKKKHEAVDAVMVVDVADVRVPPLQTTFAMQAACTNSLAPQMVCHRDFNLGQIQWALLRFNTRHVTMPNTQTPQNNLPTGMFVSRVALMSKTATRC
jgi:hypothetical protein